MYYTYRYTIYVYQLQKIVFKLVAYFFIDSILVLVMFRFIYEFERITPELVKPFEKEFERLEVEDNLNEHDGDTKKGKI